MQVPGHVGQHSPGGAGSGEGQGGRRHSTALQSTVGGTVGRGGFVGAVGGDCRLGTCDSRTIWSQHIVTFQKNHNIQCYHDNAFWLLFVHLSCQIRIMPRAYMLSH